jgi:hypothetical protein
VAERVVRVCVRVVGLGRDERVRLVRAGRGGHVARAVEREGAALVVVLGQFVAVLRDDPDAICTG